MSCRVEPYRARVYVRMQWPGVSVRYGKVRRHVIAQRSAQAAVRQARNQTFSTRGNAYIRCIYRSEI